MENNVKGVRIREILKNFFWESDDVSQETQQSSKTDAVFKKVWEDLDEKVSKLTDEGTQTSKNKCKRKNSLKKGVEVNRIPTVEKSDNVQITETYKDKEIGG